MAGRRYKLFLVITKSNWGGAQRYVYDLATNLPKDIFQTSVILGGEGPLKSKLQAKNIPTHTISTLSRDISIYEDFLSFLSILKFFYKEKPHIVHLNSSKIGGLGSLAARLLGVKKIILTVHGLAINEDRGWFEKIILGFLYRLMGMFSHQIIAVSENLKKELASLGVREDKIVIIHNGVGIPEILNREVARVRLMKKSRKLRLLETSSPSIWIGRVGELHPIKGLFYAIESMVHILKENSSVKLIIAGEGELKEEMASMIKKKGLGNSVFLLGHVPDIELYLKAFDIFLVSSTSEGLGYVILEAGEASLPVVSTEVGGIPEIIEHRENGILVPPKDPRAMADAILSLCDNEAMRKRLGTELRQTVRKRFSLERMVERTIVLYQNI